MYNACNGNIICFADDTTLYLTGTDIISLFETANNEIKNLYNWLCSNKLSLNAKKTQYIIIRPKHRNHNIPDLKITIDGTELSHCTSAKFLGVFIDEHLSWNTHVTYMNNKLSKSLYIMNQVKNIFPYNILKTLYYTLFNCHLSYGLLVWGNAVDKTLNKTKLLQKRALRIINKAKYNSHTDPLFVKSEILKLSDMYKMQVCAFMFDYKNNKLPLSFNNCYPTNAEVHINQEMQTRQSDLFYIPKSNNSFVSKLPNFIYPKVSNEFFYSNLAMSKPVFKKYLTFKMLQEYSTNIKCYNRNCPDCFKQQ